MSLSFAEKDYFNLYGSGGYLWRFHIFETSLNKCFSLIHALLIVVAGPLHQVLNSLQKYEQKEVFSFLCLLLILGLGYHQFSDIRNLRESYLLAPYQQGPFVSTTQRGMLCNRHKSLSSPQETNS